jgi:hypothetical protein
MYADGVSSAKFREAFFGNADAREFGKLRHTTPGTPPPPIESGLAIEFVAVKRSFHIQKIATPSGWNVVWRRRTRPIRKNIIGHAALLPNHVICRSGLRNIRAFAELQQQTCQHRRSVFVEPLVEQRDDFLSQIGGVIQPRQLVRLQRSARSRKQKFPWRLTRRIRFGHRASCGDRMRSVTVR